MQLSKSPPPCQSAFGPRDLDVLEQVYASIWTTVRGNDPFRNPRRDEDLQESIRRSLFAYATSKGTSDPEALKEAVLESLNGHWNGK